MASIWTSCSRSTSRSDCARPSSERWTPEAQPLNLEPTWAVRPWRTIKSSIASVYAARSALGVDLAAGFAELARLVGEAQGDDAVLVHLVSGRVLANVLRDLHRAEMRPAHRAEVR